MNYTIVIDPGATPWTSSDRESFVGKPVRGEDGRILGITKTAVILPDGKMRLDVEPLIKS